MSISQELISLREASKISGYHSDYLSFLIRNSKLKGQRIGRMWLINKNEFERFLKNKEVSKTNSSFLNKLSKVIFATFITIAFVFFTFHILHNPEEHIKIANNISQKNDF